MAYFLDTNVFIQAKNLHYGFDFCPAFWEWLIAKNAEEKVFSIEKVRGEVRVADDELSSWVSERGDEFFLKPDDATIPALGHVSAWVTNHSRYTHAAASTFLQEADYYLVAQAMAGQHVVVTHEVPADTPHKIKIPNACIEMRITCMNPFEMLRTEEARFVFGS